MPHFISLLLPFITCIVKHLWRERDGHNVRLRLKCDGTRRRTSGEVKGNQKNGVGNKEASHDCRTQAPTSRPAG